MEDSNKIEQFINTHSKWKEELILLRKILNKTELKEEVKWGAPSYTLNKKILIGLGAFKNHMGIWFHQGILLKDSHKKLNNEPEVKSKALRQWRIVKGDSINEKHVLEYITETIENHKAGKEIKPQRNKTPFILPDVLKTALSKDSVFAANFKELTPGKQREYVTYISEAKRETTKLSRLEKSIVLVNQKKGLFDKYKNC